MIRAHRDRHRRLFLLLALLLPVLLLAALRARPARPELDRPLAELPSSVEMEGGR
ncbi:MAG: hypothetical protein IPJ17_10480 [Holophagales bacterium]|nr:MAG: hypothetical protein IPJ17_10480 [Holophagales bacterium]